MAGAIREGKRWSVKSIMDFVVNLVTSRPRRLRENAALIQEAETQQARAMRAIKGASPDRASRICSEMLGEMIGTKST